jgi:hypothetical protein
MLHKNNVLNIKGRSYRLRDLEQANLPDCPAACGGEPPDDVPPRYLILLGSRPRKREELLEALERARARDA